MKKELPWYIKLKNFVFSNLYLILLSYSSAFLIFYVIYYFSEQLRISLVQYSELIEYLKSLSLIAFTGGIFTVALKYIQYLKLFENEFDRIINSDNFHNKMEKVVSSITFSEEFLSKQGNINEIWKNITLFKYKKEFPELYTKVEQKIKNELFERNSLSQYYNNVQINYEFKLRADNITIDVVEKSSFTIKRNNTENFDWEFFVSFVRNLKDEVDNPTSILDSNNTKVNNEVLDINKCTITNQADYETYTLKKFKYPLEGRKEYHIERCFVFSQNINEDRIVSFSSSNVVDDLTIRIKKCDKLEIVFEPVNGNEFSKENLFDDRMCYVNRDVFLPGEKYKLFLFKKAGI